MGKNKGGKRLGKKQVSELLQNLFQHHPNETFSFKQIFRALKLDTHPLKMLAIDVMEEMAWDDFLLKLPLMDFVALPILAGDLAGLLVAVHRRGRGQEAQTWQALDITFHMAGVQYFHTHHLVASTDTQYGRALAMSPDDGLGTSVATQFIQVMKG